MRTLEEALAAIKPRATIDYLDVVGVWLKRQLSPREFQRIDRNCIGGADFRPVTSYANSLSPYQWRLTLRQPTKAALEQVAQLADAFANYLEIARNWLLDNPWDAETLDELFRKHFAQPWHGKKGVVAYAYGFSTRTYPRKGQRRTGLSFNWYSDRPCKITGTRYCFHFEGKHQGRRSVRSLGIDHPRDLLRFNFNGYFANQLSHWYVIDYERLGRFHLNKRSGSKRQKPRIRWYGSYAYNVDAATGGIIYRRYALDENETGWSLQRFIDRYGKGRFLQRVRQAGSTLYSDHGANTIMLSEVPAAQAHPAISDFPSDHPVISSALPRQSQQRIPLDLPIRSMTESDPLRPQDADLIQPRPRTRSQIRIPLTDADLQPRPIIEPRPRTRPAVDLIQPSPRTRRNVAGAA
jgi:hypothetical protein